MSVYDSHVAWEKSPGQVCRRCGACCNQNCEHFRWEYFKTGAGPKVGDRFLAGNDKGYIRAICLIFEQAIVAPCGCTPDQRQNFPYDPWQMPKLCAFQTWQPEEVLVEPGD